MLTNVTSSKDKVLQRVLKNRQSAQASRERRRRYVSDLEMGRAQLFLQTQVLQQRVSQLESDKAQLLDQISLLRQEFMQLKNRQLANEQKSEQSERTVVEVVTEPAIFGSDSGSLPSASEPLCGSFSLTSTLPPLSSSIMTFPSPLHRLPSFRRVSTASVSLRSCSFWNCSPHLVIRQSQQQHSHGRFRSISW